VCGSTSQVEVSNCPLPLAWLRLTDAAMLRVLRNAQTVHVTAWGALGRQLCVSASASVPTPAPTARCSSTTMHSCNCGTVRREIRD
jgi:hypothetical protein